MGILTQRWSLTPPQFSIANHVASMRRVSNEQKDLPPKNGAPTGWAGFVLDFGATGAELAVASYLNLFWCGTVGNYGARDVGGLVEVRSTKPGYHLRLHPEDPDETPVVLAWLTEDLCDYDLVGWVFGYEGKQQKFWRDWVDNKRHAFFVPPDGEHLRDMTELRDWVEQHRFVEGGGARTEGQDLKALGPAATPRPGNGATSGRLE